MLSFLVEPVCKMLRQELEDRCKWIASLDDANIGGHVSSVFEWLCAGMQKNQVSPWVDGDVLRALVGESMRLFEEGDMVGGKRVWGIVVRYVGPVRLRRGFALRSRL